MQNILTNIVLLIYVLTQHIVETDISPEVVEGSIGFLTLMSCFI
jgi:hypothetical protein